MTGAMTPEGAARAKIDEGLAACGWSIQDHRQLNLSASRELDRSIVVRSQPSGARWTGRQASPQGERGGARQIRIVLQAFRDALAARTAAHPDEMSEKVRWLYEALFARPPSAAEIALVAQRVADSAQPAAWEPLCHVLLCANEFSFID